MRLPLTLVALLLVPTAHAQTSAVVYGAVSFDLASDDPDDGFVGAGADPLLGDGVGVALYGFSGRAVGGIEVHSQTTGRLVLVNGGFDLLGRPTVQAYPLVGFGLGESLVRFEGGSGEIPVGARLTDRQFLLNVGVGGDVLLPLQPGREGVSVLALGVRAGYLVAVDEGVPLTGVSAEAASLSGPYVRLLVGFGRLRR